MCEYCTKRKWSFNSLFCLDHFFVVAGLLACLDGYMNIAMEQTEVGDDASHLCVLD